MESQNLKRAIPKSLLELCEQLAKANFRAWIVGGSVRDHLMRRARADKAECDWDVATDALPEQVQRLFRKVIPTGIKHGTVTVLLHKQAYEVTTLRGETTYSDGRHPDDIFFVDDIRADLARRDFTVNAIAYDPLSGELIDPFDGCADLDAGLLRAVGEPSERFGEDGLRVLRAARFVATLEMQLEEATEAAIRPSLPTYRRVSAERIREEWFKLLGARQPSRGLDVMYRHGLLEASLPEITTRLAVGEPLPITNSSWQNTLDWVNLLPRSPILRTAALLSGPELSLFSPTHPDLPELAAERAKVACQRLRCSKAEQEQISVLTRLLVSGLAGLDAPPALRRWLRPTPSALLGEFWELSKRQLEATLAPASELEALALLKSRAEAELAAKVPLSVKDLKLTGQDLMRELNIPPGKIIGEILNGLLEIVLDDPSLNQRELLLKAAKPMYIALS